MSLAARQHMALKEILVNKDIGSTNLMKMVYDNVIMENNSYTKNVYWNYAVYGATK